MYSSGFKSATWNLDKKWHSSCSREVTGEDSSALLPHCKGETAVRRKRVTRGDNMNQLKHVLNLAKRSRLDLAVASPLFLVVMIVGIIIS
jgi:hypothetical protein